MSSNPPTQPTQHVMSESTFNGLFVGILGTLSLFCGIYFLFFAHDTFAPFQKIYIEVGQCGSLLGIALLLFGVYHIWRNQLGRAVVFIVGLFGLLYGAIGLVVIPHANNSIDTINRLDPDPLIAVGFIILGLLAIGKAAKWFLVTARG